MTRMQLMRTMTADEMADWEALEAVEPFGEAREDLRIARLAAQVAMFIGVKKLGDEPFTESDLVLDFGADGPADPAERSRDPVAALFDAIDAQAAHARRTEKYLLAWAKAVNARFEEQGVEVEPETPPEDEAR